MCQSADVNPSFSKQKSKLNFREMKEDGNNFLQCDLAEPFWFDRTRRSIPQSVDRTSTGLLARSWRKMFVSVRGSQCQPDRLTTT